MLKVGIVGLPNAGKSTLFNALVSHNKAQTAPYPFTTIDKNLGVVVVPDETLISLAKVENIAKVTPVMIEFVDIAGLIKGAHQGEGLGNQFLHHIREVDLILHLVRFFKNYDIPHVHSQLNSEEDIEVVNEELLYADLGSLRRRLDSPKNSDEEKELLNKIINNLNQGIPAYKLRLTEKEKELAQLFNLLTFKRQLIVANIDEKEVNEPPKQIKGQPVLTISAKLEAELIELSPAEQQNFLQEYGLTKSAKDNIIIESYKALDIISFYTIAKHSEAKGWVVKKGSTAVQAAGKIHTDFSDHFVKVEQINAIQLINISGWHKAHELGKILTHGKDYLVQNQDVLEFKVALKQSD